MAFQSCTRLRQWGQAFGLSLGIECWLLLGKEYHLAEDSSRRGTQQWVVNSFIASRRRNEHLGPEGECGGTSRDPLHHLTVP